MDEWMWIEMDASLKVYIGKYSKQGHHHLDFLHDFINGHHS